jgi:alkanesulfonate monooxygenase SsuD/methylene tetrahydromethanopterin reductase-like flavin-dependent oxidoreductase (luciferase family)
MEEIVPFLERAWTGEPFEWRGRTVRVTPRPLQEPRPPILMGGASEVAARRAARLADHFIPSVPELYEVYRAERRRLGKPDPGPAPGSAGNFLWVAEDPDAAWQRIAPHALHEVNAYGRWMEEAGIAGAFQTYQRFDSADALRRSGLYPIYRPEELVAKARALGPMGVVNFHPLMGGLPPELAWECLQLVEARVLPALR